MEDSYRSFLDMQKERVKKWLESRRIDEIYKAVEILPLSNREKIVFKAVLSRELEKGIVGSTAKEILEEIRRFNDEGIRGSRIGIKIWTVLNQLREKLLIQATDSSPKLYFLNREMNPIHRFMYHYSLLESLYDILPELHSRDHLLYRIHPERMMSPSSGVYSTNQEFLKILIEITSLAKKEILSTSLVAQSFEEFPLYTYTLAKTLERGVRMYCLLSDKAPTNRIEGFKKLGAIVKVVSEEVLRQHDISNIDIVDQMHFIQVNRYEYSDGKKIRFGFWHKYNKTICAKYVKSFWEVWNT